MDDGVVLSVITSLVKHGLWTRSVRGPAVRIVLLLTALLPGCEPFTIDGAALHCLEDDQCLAGFYCSAEPGSGEDGSCTVGERAPLFGWEPGWGFIGQLVERYDVYPDQEDDLGFDVCDFHWEMQLREGEQPPFDCPGCILSYVVDLRHGLDECGAALTPAPERPGMYLALRDDILYLTDGGDEWWQAFQDGDSEPHHFWSVGEPQAAASYELTVSTELWWE